MDPEANEVLALFASNRVVGLILEGRAGVAADRRTNPTFPGLIPFARRSVAGKAVRDVRVDAALDGDMLLLFSFGVAPVRLISQREHKQDGQCSQADDDYSCELLYGPHKRPLLLPKPVSHVIGSSAIRNYAVYGVAWSGL